MKKLILLFSLLWSFAASSADVKLLVPYAPGGSADKISRIIAEHISTPDLRIVIDYKTGAGGIVAANYLAGIKTGTVLMLPGGSLVTAPLTNPEAVKYNLDKDFIFVEYIGTEPTILVVNKQLGIKTFTEFLALSKKRSLFYGSAGIGTNSQIAAGVIAGQNKNLIHVPYKGGSAAIAGLLANDVQWLLESDATLSSLIASGNLIPIAVSFDRRLKDYPNVPTLKELGIDDKNYYRWHALVSNSSANVDILTIIKERLADPRLVDKLSTLGIHKTPVNDENFISSEYEKMKTIIK